MYLKCFASLLVIHILFLFISAFFRTSGIRRRIRMANRRPGIRSFCFLLRLRHHSNSGGYFGQNLRKHLLFGHRNARQLCVRFISSYRGQNGSVVAFGCEIYTRIRRGKYSTIDGVFGGS